MLKTNVYTWPQGGGSGGLLGVTAPPPPVFVILCPFFKKQKTKMMKNWEKLNESGQLNVQPEERKHKYKYSC